MNKTKRIAFGIGIVVAVLAAFTAPAMAGPNTAFFTNYSGDTSPGGTSYVELWVNVTDSHGSYHPDYAFGALDINVTFDSSIGDITACNPVPGHPWDGSWMKSQWGDSWVTTVSYDCWAHPGPPYGLGPGVYPIANYTIEGNNPGIMDLAFSHELPRYCAMTDCVGEPYPNQTWEDGTYTCGAASCPPPGDTVITTSCELDQDYTVSEGEAGYIIGANGVTIDGEGYKITGTTTASNCEWGGESSPCTVSGIYNAGYDNVEIKNLEIEGFCTGIALKGAGADKIMGNTIDNCEIHDNGFNTTSGGSEMVTHGVHACWLDGSADEPALTITHNEINNNEGTGSACGDGGNGIFIYAGSPDAKHEYCNISYNNLNGNAKAGFWTKMMLSESVITHNNATGNGAGTGISDDVRGGIILRCKMTDDNLVAYNNVSNNGDGTSYGYGIYVGGNYNTIINNTANESTARGISMGRSDGLSNNELRNNTVCWNDLDGIYITGGVTGNTLFDNVVCFNGQVSGVDIYDGDDTTGDDNTCDTTYGYDDEGATGCTYGCPGQTYTISGYTNPAADKVNITNLNKPDTVDDRPADYIGPDGFYNLTLDVPGEVDTNDVLQIIACRDTGNNESNCNITNHEVMYISGEENVNLTLNHFCRNYMTYPYRTWEQSNWSGPAVMQMMVDHYRPQEPTQSDLNETGIAHNQGCNADLLQVDPAGMRWTLNDILHNTSSYGGGKYANYGIGSYTDINDTLHYMCKWHYLGPGAAPAYGDYSNWMAVRGIHTDVKPTFAQGSYKIYGFWMNDPYNETLEGPGGIGENTYKSVEQWKSTYHLMLNVNEDDSYNGTYVAVSEPPEDDDVEVTLAKPKPRFTDAITPMLAEEPMMVYGVEQLALEKVVKDDELLEIVQATIDGVTEELIPYDTEFAEVFAKAVAGKPMLVTSDNGNYYVVPFNLPVNERSPVEIMPVEIERVKVSGLKEFERVTYVDGKIVLKPIPIEPIKVEKTLVVVLVDAEDGSFKEVSWVADPEKYLPVSKVEALKLALGEIDIMSATELKSELVSKPTIELVYRDASPYYPDWKITVDSKVFFVGQDGTVSCDEPEEPPEYSSYLTYTEEYIGWGAGSLDPTGMVDQVDYYYEQGIQACAPIGPGCIPMEIAQEIIENDPCEEAWYITDDPVGVVILCPA